jgi:hypothetical protein
MDQNSFYNFLIDNLNSLFTNFINYFLKFDLLIKNFQYLLDYEKEKTDNKTKQ